jgi:predicted ATPase/DNA-binding CsgD family transcriptional regulator
MELLERTSQLQAFRSALTQAQAGEGCVALVYGEAGIGKTSLVEQFIEENKKNCRVLRGACDSLFTPRPLGPLHDIALQISSSQGTHGDLSALLESETSREAIFSACLKELKNQSTMMIFEDIHWADEATLDLLKYLGRRIRQTSSLLVLTYRDDELGADHPLRLLLGDLGSSQALHRIPVPSLSKDAVRTLAKGKEADPFALHHLTNGNPFFVTEVLAIESGIPETVRDAVLTRAARLSAEARSVLDSAAVIGSRIEPWLLAEIAGAESTKIEECISRGMLQVQGDYYAFRHELARQTILESISSPKKIALHRRTLDALKESPATRENLARLAHHAEALNDPRAVLEFAPLAAWWASELGAHREAAGLYKAALQYARTAAPEVRAELLDAYADECVLLDQRKDAKQAQEEALHIWQNLGRGDREGRAYRRLSEIDHDFVLGTDREQNALRAIEILEKLPPSVELARAYSHLARQHLNLNTASEADPVYWGLRAIQLAEQLGDIETLAHALNTVGTWEMGSDEPAKGQAKLERSLKLSLDNNLQFHAARAFLNLGRELLLLRDYAASLGYIKRGLEYCIHHDLDEWHSVLLTDRAEIKFQQGHWAEAYQDLQTVLKRINSADSFDIFSIMSILLKIEARRGDPLSPKALIIMRDAVPKVNSLPIKCHFASLFAQLAWLNGNLEQCRAEAEPTYRMALQLNYQPSGLDDSRFSELSYWMWRAGAITQPLAGVIEPYASQIRGNWQAAATMWEKYGCPYEQGMALMDGDEVAQLAALEIFERLGARPIIEILKQKMQAQGRRIPRGPRPSTREHPFGLTTRELEVLASLAEGSSNLAIAQQLNLSPRTVEHHITSILQKMGVLSRNEAVAKALKDNLLFPE